MLENYNKVTKLFIYLSSLYLIQVNIQEYVIYITDQKFHIVFFFLCFLKIFYAYHRCICDQKYSKTLILLV